MLGDVIASLHAHTLSKPLPAALTCRFDVYRGGWRYTMTSLIPDPESLCGECMSANHHLSGYGAGALDHAGAST